MYPPELVAPMKTDLTEVGVTELITAEDVDNALKQDGTTLVVLNSVCGCAAGSMRPGVKLALQHSKLPNHKTTAFAGVDTTQSIVLESSCCLTPQAPRASPFSKMAGSCT